MNNKNERTEISPSEIIVEQMEKFNELSKGENLSIDEQFEFAQIIIELYKALIQ